MKNLFIPYELAVIAKEKGFNEPCLTAFTPEDGLLDVFDCEEPCYLTNKETRTGVVAAPLYQQIIDWLREEHEIFVHVEPEHDYKKLKYYRGQLVIKGAWKKLVEEFDSYEQAREAVIKKAFELI